MQIDCFSNQNLVQISSDTIRKGQRQQSNLNQYSQNSILDNSQPNYYLIEQGNNFELPKDSIDIKWSVEYFRNIENNLKLNDPFLKYHILILDELVKSQYYLCSYLTQGGEGYIFEGYIYENSLKLEVVFKILIDIKQKDIEEEITIMQRFEQHTSVIKIIHSLQISDNIYVFVLEKCKYSLKEELKNMILKTKQFSTEKFFKIILDLFDGLVQFRIYNILHLDIKPHNILVTLDDSYIYSDFGLSQLKKGEDILIKNKGFTRKYASKEVLLNNKKDISYTSDIYSLGKTFEEIVEVFNSINPPEKIIQEFQSKIIQNMINPDISKRKDCKHWHKILISILTDFNNYYYWPILFQYSKKIENIVNLYPFDQNKDIKYFYKIMSYYYRIYITILEQQLILFQKDSFEYKKLNQLIYLNARGLSFTYTMIGKYEQALTQQLRSLKIVRYLFERDHQETAISLKMVASCYQNIGNSQESLSHHLQSLKMYQRLFKDNNPHIAASLYSISHQYQMIGDIQNAKKFHEQSLTMGIQLFGGFQQPNSSSDNLKLELIESIQRQESYLHNYNRQELIILNSDLLKENYYDLTTFTNNLGQYCLSIGQYENALNYFLSSINDYNSSYHQNDPFLATLLDNIGQCYFYMNELQCALEYFQESHLILKDFFIESHPIIAKSLNNLGSLYLQLGSIQTSLKYLNQSNVILTTLFKLNHPDVAALLHNLGYCYYKIGEYEQAIDFNEQSLKMKRNLYKNHHPDIAASLNNLGTCHKKIKDLKNADHYFQASLDMFRLIYKSDHLSIATTLNNIGACNQDAENYKSALGYQLESLKMLKRIFKENNIYIAKSINNIGMCYLNLGECQYSLKYFILSLSLLINLLQKSDYEIAQCIYNLGLCFKKIGDLNAAFQCYLKSYFIRKELFRSSLNDFNIYLSNVIQCYKDINEIRETQKLDNDFYQLLEPLRLRKQVFTTNNLHYANQLSQLGIFYQRLGDYSNSLNYFQQHFDMLKEIYNKQIDHSLAGYLDNLGICYKDVGDYQNSLYYMKEAFEMRKILFNQEQSGDIATSLHNIGVTYLDLKDYQNSMDYLNQSLSMRQKIYKGNHPDIASSFQQLGSLFLEISDYKQALFYQTSSLKMRSQLLEGNKNDIGISLKCIGECHYQTGNIRLSLNNYLESFLMRYSFFKRYNNDAVISLLQIGICYKDIGDDEKAVRYQLKAFQYKKKLIGFRNKQVISCFNKFYERHNLRLEQDLCDQLIEYQNKKQQYKGNHIDIALILSKIGQCYRNIGLYNYSLSYQKESTDMINELFQENQLKRATSLYQIGLSYQDSNCAQEALCYQLQSLDIRKQILSKNHPDIAVSLNIVGLCFQQIGDYKQATKYLLQSHEMRRKLNKQNQNHRSIAKSLNDIGMCYRELGDIEIAFFYCQEAFIMRQQLFQPIHSDISVSLNSVGLCLKDKGELNVALDYLLKSFKLRLKLFKGRHPDTIASIDSIAQCLIEMKQYSQALVYSIISFKMNKLEYQSNNIKVAQSLHQLGLCYQNLGNPDLALNCFKISLDFKKKQLNDNHLDIIQPFNHISQCYAMIGDTKINLDYFSKSIKVQQKQLTDNGDETAILIGSLISHLHNYFTIINDNTIINIQEQRLQIKSFINQIHSKRLQFKTLRKEINGNGLYQNSMETVELLQFLFQHWIIIASFYHNRNTKILFKEDSPTLISQFTQKSRNKNLEEYYQQSKYLIDQQLQKEGYYLETIISNEKECLIYAGQFKSEQDSKCKKVILKIYFPVGDEEIEKEMQVLKRLKQIGNYFRFIMIIKVSNDVYVIALDKCEYTLKNEQDKIKAQNSELSLSKFLKMVLQLLQGILLFKIFKYFHLEIKLETILVTNEGDYVYTDFTISVLKEYYITKKKQEKKRAKSDIVSLRKIFQQMLMIFKEQQSQHLEIIKEFEQNILDNMDSLEIESRDNCYRCYGKFVQILMNYKEYEQVHQILNEQSIRIQTILKFFQHYDLQSLTYLSNVIFLLYRTYFEINGFYEKYEKLQLEKSRININQMQKSSILDPCAERVECPNTFNYSDNKMKQQFYQDVIQYYLQTITKIQEFKSNNSPYIAILLESIGVCYQNLGQYNSALNYFLDSLKIKIKYSFNNSHSLLLFTICNVANCFLDIKDYKNSFNYYLTYLNMNSLQSHKNFVIATQFKNIGQSYQFIGNYHSAFKHLLQSLTMRYNQFNYDFLSFSDTLYNIGVCYQIFGDYSCALEYLKESLNIRKYRFEGENQELANTLNRIGQCYLHLQNYNNAFDYFQQQVNIRQNLFNKDSIDITASLINIVQYYQSIMDFRKSLQYLLHQVHLGVHKFNFQYNAAYLKNLLSLSNKNLIAYNTSLKELKVNLISKNNIFKINYGYIDYFLSNISYLQNINKNNKNNEYQKNEYQKKEKIDKIFYVDLSTYLYSGDKYNSNIHDKQFISKQNSISLNTRQKLPFTETLKSIKINQSDSSENNLVIVNTLTNSQKLETIKHNRQNTDKLIQTNKQCKINIGVAENIQKLDEGIQQQRLREQKMSTCCLIIFSIFLLMIIFLFIKE